LSKETGVTIDQLRAFGALGERFGVTTETMQNGVMRFSESMSRMRKRYGEEYTSLQAMGLGVVAISSNDAQSYPQDSFWYASKEQASRTNAQKFEYN
jgi:hypothetical protein